METLQSAMKAAANAAAAAAVEKVAATAATPAVTASEPAVAPAVPDEYVTLDQIAARVNKCKRTMENRISRMINPFSDPDIQGAGGKASEWLWSKVRPWLEIEFERPLPEPYPNVKRR